MITATRRPSPGARAARPRPECDLERLPQSESDGPRSSAQRSGPAALSMVAIESPVAAALDVESTGGEAGLLLAFVVTTLIMVVGVVALTALSAWWALVPVVLVHWIATSVILARISGLLNQS
jgi:hypothetical protein